MRATLPFCLLLASCSAGETPASLPEGAKADRIVVVKHQGWLTAYDGKDELITFFNIDFGHAKVGRKRFEGDGLTPEGQYRIERRDGPATCSLRISYPNVADRAYAEARGRSAGDGIVIRAKFSPLPRNVQDHGPKDGGIALGEAEMRQLCAIVPDGIPITIDA